MAEVILPQRVLGPKQSLGLQRRRDEARERVNTQRLILKLLKRSGPRKPVSIDLQLTQRLVNIMWTCLSFNHISQQRQELITPIRCIGWVMEFIWNRGAVR